MQAACGHLQTACRSALLHAVGGWVVAMEGRCLPPWLQARYSIHCRAAAHDRPLQNTWMGPSQTKAKRGRVCCTSAPSLLAYRRTTLRDFG